MRRNVRLGECFSSLRDTGWDNPCYPLGRPVMDVTEDFSEKKAERERAEEEAGQAAETQDGAPAE